MTTTARPSDPSEPARPRRRRRPRAGPRWLDFSIAATALVVSVASLLVARHQAQVMDRQLAASVWPSVRPSASYTDGDATGSPAVVFSLDNRGTGPARLQSHRVSYRGRPVRNLNELLAACCDVDTAQAAASLAVAANEAYVVGRVLGSSEHVDWLGIRFPAAGGARGAAAFRSAARAARHDVSTRLCYCSVLDDCWITGSGLREPARVATCDEERKQPQYN